MNIKERKMVVIQSIENMDEKLFIQIEKFLGKVHGNESLIELVNRALASEQDIASGNLLTLDDAEKLLDQQLFK
ncbi:hypothetical protein Aoki45_26040 [Algoriphagus sp. oki45]|uniref:hypothetical protein n=1 Tax=Algoriphagus sp. oki45 TaxID=3067294 RepID=UPI0027F662DB|nr:hypothetical protein Aoki45_26040 [Algoriphagus sp. oki45]